MSSLLRSRQGCRVRAYRGDAMTLLCFDLSKSKISLCAGFSIRITTPAGKSYYLYNRLSFDRPLTASTGPQAEAVASTPSDQAPFQVFSWLHVPTSSYDAREEFGPYSYEVTPRYFDKQGHLLPLDPKRTVSLEMEVSPFTKGKLKLGFTRGFMISQAYARRFGNDSSLRPPGRKLLFNTAAVSGHYPATLKQVGGHPYSYLDQYEWMGWQARNLVFSTLQEVVQHPALSVDVFAYDLDEPDIAGLFLKLAAQGRIRMILDNSSSHVSAENKPSSEDLFENAFRKTAAGGAEIVRGRYSRQAHQKTLVIKNQGHPVRVLTGSTNFAINGLYINSNHVIVLDNRQVAEKYAAVFESSFQYLNTHPKPSLSTITGSADYDRWHHFGLHGLPSMDISFAPHNAKRAETILDDMNKRIRQAKESVLFAVMSLASNTSGPIVSTLRDLHQDAHIFSYGITDKYDGVMLYKPGSVRGLLVDTTRLQKKLPPPFSEELGTSAHKVHHKFVIVDFKSTDAVLYCGSSNLALLGEEQNGDNLLAIHDRDIATAFAIEAFRLVDHYHFRSALQSASANEPLTLSADDSWTREYYQEGHLKKLQREYLIR